MSQTRGVPILRVTELPVGLESLILESEAEGFEFVRRLQRERLEGLNRVDQPGELLVASFCGQELDAIVGINRDPYLGDPKVGRLRHVYVRADRRNSGIGSALVRALLEAAQANFECIRLRAATPRSDAFYERLGFQRMARDTEDATATHRRPAPGGWG